MAPHTRFLLPPSHGHERARLDEVVRAWLAHELGRDISKAVARKLIMAGTVRVDGALARRPGMLLSARNRLEASVDLARIPSAVDRDAGVTEDVGILYEDEHLVAVSKPAGLVMHVNADAGRPNLFDRVRRLLADRAGSPRPSLPYLGLHHRLDVETSGVVLFTKDRRANAPLAACFAAGDIQKIYHAIVLAPDDVDVPPTWHIDNRVASIGTGRRARVRDVASGGLHAATAFRVAEALGPAGSTRSLLVEAQPHTGRKHQIRAHLAQSGLPILGDSRYGAAVHVGSCRADRVMLHAWRLSLRHPVTDRPLTVTCPYPADFTRVLACLRRA